MIKRDRELLARVAAMNTKLGLVVVTLVDQQDGGELPADGLRELGRYLGSLSVDLVNRADEIDEPAIDPVVSGGEQHPATSCQNGTRISALLAIPPASRAACAEDLPRGELRLEQVDNAPMSAELGDFGELSDDCSGQRDGMQGGHSAGLRRGT